MLQLSKRKLRWPYDCTVLARIGSFVEIQKGRILGTWRVSGCSRFGGFWHLYPYIVKWRGYTKGYHTAIFYSHAIRSNILFSKDILIFWNYGNGCLQQFWVLFRSISYRGCFWQNGIQYSVWQCFEYYVVRKWLVIYVTWRRNIFTELFENFALNLMKFLLYISSSVQWQAIY